MTASAAEQTPSSETPTQAQLGPVPSGILPELVEAYAARHRALENYTLAWFLMFRALRALGLQPHSSRGRLASAAYVLVLFLLLPLAASAIVGGVPTAAVRTWVVVALAFAVLGSLSYEPFQRSIDTFLSLHRALAEEEGIRRLIDWDRRWFSLRASVPAGSAFALAMLAYLQQAHASAPDAALHPIPPGTVVVCALLLYQVGEISYVVTMLGLESRLLRGYRYRLFKLGPSDTVAVRRSVRGSNALGMLVGVVSTLFILAFVLLLGDRPALVGKVAFVLLVIAYLSTGAGVVLPRLAMRRIVVEEQERELLPLQARLDALSTKLSALTEEEFREISRLKLAHDSIANSNAANLSFRTLGYLAGTVLLPTLTFIATHTGEAVVLKALGGKP